MTLISQRMDVSSELFVHQRDPVVIAGCMTPKTEIAQQHNSAMDLF
jgi:hypothetical protein